MQEKLEAFSLEDVLTGAANGRQDADLESVRIRKLIAKLAIAHSGQRRRMW